MIAGCRIPLAIRFDLVYNKEMKGDKYDLQQQVLHSGL
jgi:hypothetical protein